MLNLTTTDSVALLNHARWAENSPRTMILKCRVQDGPAILAAIERMSDNRWRWEVFDRLGFAPSRYAAQRAARKALRG